MEKITLLAPISALTALVFAAYLAWKVMRLPQGNTLMVKISGAIRKGANAYLRIQYRGVALRCFAATQ